MRNRLIAGLLALALSAGLFLFGAPMAQAGSKGRKNTAIGLGALAAYQLLKGKTTTGVVAGAGAAAAYAYKRYDDARKDERRYSRYYSRSRDVPGSYNSLAYEPYSRYGTSSTYRSYSRYPNTGTYRTYRTSRPYRSRTRYRSV